MQLISRRSCWTILFVLLSFSLGLACNSIQYGGSGGETGDQLVADDDTPDPTESPSPTDCDDIDGDGFCPPNDCDDFNFQVNPGADEVCNNFREDDCDGLTDCDDSDCNAHPACTGQQTEDCTNGVDDDSDGAVDCDDADCSGHPNCGGTAEDCTNGADDDGDGFIDCNDSDCSGHPNCAPPPEDCTNGVDDDGDGSVDCNDSDCFSHPNCTGGGGCGVNLLNNSNFESGNTVWLESSSNGFAAIVNQAVDPTTLGPHGGSWQAWLGGADDEYTYIDQSFSVPASSTSLTASLWFYVETQDSTAFAYDLGACAVLDGSFLSGGTVLELVLLVDNTTPSIISGWTYHTINLAAYAGQTIFFACDMGTDFSGPTNFFVDDIVVNCN